MFITINDDTDMNQENQEIYNEQEEQESSINFGEIFAAMKKHKKLYRKVLLLTFLFGCIFTLSLPNYYKCEVLLSPELNSRRSTSNLASLASSFGLNITGAMGNATEALFPTLYPDLVNSSDFKTTLFPIKVHRDKETEMMTYYDYLLNEQKAPWWSEAISGTLKFIVSLFSDKKEDADNVIDPFRLTKKQAAIVKAIEKKVVCDVDKKTMVISITVTDQDPLICATMADSVQHRLQDFITDYRTKKAKVDLAYNQKIYKEAKARYDRSRQLYATFVDANQDVILESVRQKQTELENEMQLMYNAYAQVAAQLQVAEAKVQEETPAFTSLQSATVPVKKAGPGRAKICLVLLFLAFLGTTVWILNKENQLKSLLGLN